MWHERASARGHLVNFSGTNVLNIETTAESGKTGRMTTHPGSPDNQEVPTVYCNCSPSRQVDPHDAFPIYSLHNAEFITVKEEENYFQLAGLDIVLFNWTSNIFAFRLLASFCELPKLCSSQHPAMATFRTPRVFLCASMSLLASCILLSATVSATSLSLEYTPTKYTSVFESVMGEESDSLVASGRLNQPLTSSVAVDAPLRGRRFAGNSKPVTGPVAQIAARAQKMFGEGRGYYKGLKLKGLDTLPPAAALTADQFRFHSNAVPAAVDWRASKAMTPVVDQGSVSRYPHFHYLIIFFYNLAHPPFLLLLLLLLPHYYHFLSVSPSSLIPPSTLPPSLILSVLLLTLPLPPFSPPPLFPQCDSCWALVSADSMALMWKIRGLHMASGLPQDKVDALTISASAQQIGDCAMGDVCSPGYPELALEYALINGGLVSDSVYPYTGQQQKCNRTAAATIQSVEVTPLGSLPCFL